MGSSSLLRKSHIALLPGRKIPYVAEEFPADIQELNTHMWPPSHGHSCCLFCTDR
jgi:hypothetical protein